MTDPYNIDLDTLNDDALMPMITGIETSYISPSKIKLQWNMYDAKCVKNSTETETNYGIQYELIVGLTVYNIYRSCVHDGSNNFTYYTTVDSNEYDFNSFANTDIYYFKVVGIIKNDYESTFELTKPSLIVSAVVLNPINYIHIVNNNILYWERQRKLNGLKYEIWYKENGDYQLLDTITDYKVYLNTFNELKKNHTYYLKIRSKYGSYNSVFSNSKKYKK